MTEQKKPKRIRQKVIQVVVTEAEKKQIEENACLLYTSDAADEVARV